MDAADIRMIEGRGRLRLLDEAVLETGVGHQVRMDEFQRTMDLELGVKGLVDGAHAPFTNLLDNLVVGYGAADHPESALVPPL